MKKFIGLNWKMNPMSAREASVLAAAAKGMEKKYEVVVFPPFVFLSDAIRKGIKTGTQDFFYEPKGARTGEISLPMLKSLGVRYALVGHSERRVMGESDELISMKLKAALSAKFVPVFCVGEPWSARKKGRHAAEKFVARQLDSALKEVRLPKGRRTSVVVAYEPVWAIGTGRACSLSDAAAMAKAIREKTKDKRLKVLYGGSVDAKNANDFLAEKAIDGVLVGGASADIRKLRALSKVLNKL